MPLTRRQFLERSAELTAALAAAGACAPMLSRSGGSTRYTASGDEFTLATDAISATWSVAAGGLRLRHVAAGTSALGTGDDAFALTLTTGGR